MRFISRLSMALAFVLAIAFWRPPRAVWLAPLYVSRFALLYPVLTAIAAWGLAGAPGLRRLVSPIDTRDRLAARAPGGWALALITLALYSQLSTGWAFMRDLEPGVGATAAVQVAIAALFAIAAASIRFPPRTLIAALVVGLAINAPLTFAQVSNQSAIGMWEIGEFPFEASMDGVSIIEAGSWTFVRPYGLMPHPNPLAGMLVVGLLAASALAFARRGLVRAIGVVLIPVGIGALLLTFSRAAWLGLAAGGVAFVILILPEVWRAFRVDRQRAIRWLLSGAGAAIVLTALVGAAFVITYRPLLAARIGEGQESIEMRSISDRLVFTDFALRSIRERPVLGVGIGNFPWRTSYYLTETTYDLRGDNVHNVLLTVTAELGTIGLLLFAVAMGSGFMAAWLAIRQSRRAGMEDSDRTARVALVSIGVALGTIGMFDHYPWTMLHFAIIGWGALGVALSPALSGDQPGGASEGV